MEVKIHVGEQSLQIPYLPKQRTRKLHRKDDWLFAFVFNCFLARWNETYKETGKGLTYHACSAELTQLKKECVWLQEVDSIALQSSLKNLADSYARFFKKQNKAPRFKSKKNQVQSYTTKHTNGNIAIVGNKIKLSKPGF